MNFVAQSRNRKELNLDISFYSNRLYSLPQCILNMRSLTLLKLTRVSLEGIVSLHLPSLISLELDHVLQVRNFNLSSCGKIQKLSLMSINTFIGGMMEDFILQLPLLEYLDISFCSKIQNLKIYKQHLKRFVFIGNDFCPESVITIDAPNLVSFRLLQSRVPSNFSVIAPNILDADINICGEKPYDFQCYLNLHNFLSQFDISKQLRLCFRDEVYLPFFCLFIYI